MTMLVGVGTLLARATRAERPLALILADVDHFKTVNDRLGHPAGDAVLLRVAVAFPADGTTADSLLATADRALYAAKHDGRNRSTRAAAVAYAGRNITSSTKQ